MFSAFFIRNNLFLANFFCVESDRKTILIFKIFFAKWRKYKIMGFTYTFGALLVSFLCSWTGIICWCLSYVVVVVASLCNHLVFPFVSWSLLCSSSSVWIRYKKKELAPPQGTLLCFFPIQLCVHSPWISFASLAWRHCLVRVCIWIAFTQFQNHCPSFDALTLESLIANAEELIDLRSDTSSRVVEQSEFFDRFFFL